MNIEKGDIFVLTDRVYLLVIRDPQEGFDDDYGDFPSTVECVPAVRSNYVVDDQADLEAMGLVFRDWSDMGLDWVWIDTTAANNINTDAVAKMERVAQDRSDDDIDLELNATGTGGTLQAVYAQIRKQFTAADQQISLRMPRDKTLRADLQVARDAMYNLPNAMTD